MDVDAGGRRADEENRIDIWSVVFIQREAASEMTALARAFLVIF